MIAHARGKTLYAQDLYGGANAKYRIKTARFSPSLPGILCSFDK